jgi:hypothetical protein
MAKFDPDAYLAKKPASGGFDPDAYLAAGAPAAPVTQPGQIPVDNRAQAPAAVPSSDVPVGRRVIGFVRPTIEALGGAGGAVLGTAMGPAGTVGGAGAGYAAAKTGLDALETALGYRKATQTPGADLLKDIALGATLETGGRAAGPIISNVLGRIADIGRMPTLRAAKIARDAAGPDLPALKNALAAAQGQNVTAGQATADVISPTWQALGYRSLKLDPRFTNKLAMTQDADAVNALARAAGGDTAAAVRTAVAGEKTALNAVTTPMREAALKAADAATLQPLKIDKVTSELGKILSNPKYAGNDIVQGAVKNVGEEIAAWSNKNTGVIPAEALDAIRKNAVNAAVAKLRPGMDATSQKNAASGVLTEIKPFINKAIEDAGGPGYEAYLKRHTEGMQKIAEQKLVGEALSLWKEPNKDGFIKLVQNESLDAVEKILGPGKYDIAKNLADDHMTVLREQASKALRDASVKQQVSEGQEALRNLLLQDMSKIRLPSYLSVITSTTNKALDTLERALGRRTMDALTEAMKSPKGASDLLSTLPANERVKILNVLNNPHTWGSTGQAVRSGVNALALSDERAE